MADSTLGQRLFRAIPLLGLVVIVPFAWMSWDAGGGHLSKLLALAVFLYGALTMVVSDHAVARTARNRLGRALQRNVVPGEETSLNAWMRVPTAEIEDAVDELEQVALEVEGAPFERDGVHPK